MVHTEGQWSEAKLISYGFPSNYYELSPLDQQVARQEAVKNSAMLGKAVSTPVPAVYAGVKMSRDRVQYTRQQKGHSLLLHLTLGALVLWIPAIYYTASPNHYWHA